MTIAMKQDILSIAILSIQTCYLGDIVKLTEFHRLSQMKLDILEIPPQQSMK